MFVSIFTVFDAHRLHKLYKHALKGKIGGESKKKAKKEKKLKEQAPVESGSKSKEKNRKRRHEDGGGDRSNHRTSQDTLSDGNSKDGVSASKKERSSHKEKDHRSKAPRTDEVRKDRCVFEFLGGHWLESADVCISCRYDNPYNRLPNHSSSSKYSQDSRRHYAPGPPDRPSHDRFASPLHHRSRFN